MTQIDMPKRFLKARLMGGACCAAAASMALAVSAAPAAAADKVSGSFGTSFNSHFISYGADVWGAGDSFYGSQSTLFAWSDITFDLDPVSFNFGVWGDINNNAVSGIGGDLQEVDLWAGVSYGAGPWSFGVTYQHWIYGGGVERGVDLSIGFDDSGFMPISLNPSLLWHFRVNGNKGSVIVASIAPSFALTDSISLGVPLGAAFFLDSDYQGGTKSGLAYGYGGLALGVPLTFIDSAYGDWSLDFGLTYYITSASAIPGNPDKSFLTSSVGISVGF